MTSSVKSTPMTSTIPVGDRDNGEAELSEHRHESDNLTKESDELHTQVQSGDDGSDSSDNSTETTESHGPYSLSKILVWVIFFSVLGGVLYTFRGELLAPAKRTAVNAGETNKISLAPWDGYVTVSTDAQSAMGITMVPVVSQTEPILLPILGTTKHDETKLTKVLPMFKGRAEKVYVSVGDYVEPGAPLVELYSADLAQAKTTYEIEKSQWEYEKKLLEVRTQLRATNSISEQLLLDTRNDELRQRHEYEIAREKLILFGLSDKEIDAVPGEQGASRARLTVRSPASGVVISRSVVSGNIYDDSDIMLTIAPNDHLWVWGNVFERDLGLVSLGQKWDVQFSFLDQHLSGVVEYISPNVDPGAHAVKIRTMIPNPNGKLKADMLVQGNLQVPAIPEYVVIPRIAMIVVDGRAYAFTRVPGTTDKFERHRLHVVHEKEDRVVLRNGLKPGEDVVVLGSLIMQQLYEESDMLTSGRGSRSIGDRD